MTSLTMAVSRIEPHTLMLEGQGPSHWWTARGKTSFKLVVSIEFSQGTPRNLWRNPRVPWKFHENLPYVHLYTYRGRQRVDCERSCAWWRREGTSNRTMMHSRKGISRHSQELSLLLLAAIGTIYQMAVKRCRNTYYGFRAKTHIRYICGNKKEKLLKKMLCIKRAFELHHNAHEASESFKCLRNCSAVIN